MGMIKVFKKLTRKTNDVFIHRVISILFLLLCLSARPVITYADENSLPGTEGIFPGDGTEQSDNNGEVKDSGNAFLDAMLDSVFGVTEEKDGSGFSTHEMLDEAVGIVDKAFKTITNTHSEIGAFYYMLKAVALTIMTMYFVMGLASRDFTQQFGKPTVEMLAKPFAKFIICIIILIFSEHLMKFFLYLSQWCFNHSPKDNSMLGEIAEAVGDYKKLVYDAVGYAVPSEKEGLGIMDTFKNILPFISIFIAFMLPWLVSMAAGLVSVWVVYSRTAQLIIMAIGAPLAMADLYGEHPLRETRAFNYIKEFAGLSFQSVVISLVFIAMNMVMAIFMEHFAGQVSGGASGIGGLIEMGLKIAVFKLVQVGLVVSSANRAKKLMASM